MNRNAQFEPVAYWSAAVARSNGSRTDFTFTGVSARRDQSNLPLVPICGTFGDRFPSRLLAHLAVRS
jgi:hypothetical protein